MKGVFAIFPLYFLVAIAEVPLYSNTNRNVAANNNQLLRRGGSTLDLQIPSKFTIEDLIRLTERIENQKIVNRPQNLQSSSYLPPQLSEQGFIPSTQLKPPQSQFGAPIISTSSHPENNFFPSHQQPQTQYGPPPPLPKPDKLQNFKPGNSNNQLKPPSTNYGTPLLETFGEQQIEFQRPNLPNNFLPKPFYSQKYLPPTQKPLQISTTTSPPAPTTPKTVEISTNKAAVDYDYDQPQDPQELPENGPNVSISNAVAGIAPGSVFYVQQPDGRLQKVTLQKFKEPNSKPEEYVAQYYFQNIDTTDAPSTLNNNNNNALYTPLISLGNYVQQQ